MREERLLRASVYLIFGEMMLVAMGAFFKEIETDLAFTVKIFFRNLFGWLWLLPLVLFQNKVKLKTEVIHWHFFRALVGLTGMYGFFYVIDHMKLAEASLVKLTAPLFLPLIAFLWLKERINWNHAVALLIGFLGVGFILQPGTENFRPVALIGLAAAFFQAMAKVTIRKMSLTEPYLRVVFYFGLFGTLISLFPALYNWQWPHAQLWGLLLLLGMCGTLGQLLITQAYQMASPGKVGAFTYTQMLFSVVIGYYFFDESLSWYIVAGSVLIILAGLINLYQKKEKPS